MAEAAVMARFSCTGCGKQFKWKPELAGKKTRCSGCGQICAVPDQPEAAPSASPAQPAMSVVGLDQPAPAPAVTKPPAPRATSPQPTPRTQPAAQKPVAPKQEAVVAQVAAAAPVAQRSAPVAQVTRTTTKINRVQSVEDDLYDLAPDPEPAKPRPAPVAAPQAAPAVTAPAARSGAIPTLGYVAPPKRVEVEVNRDELANELGGSPLKQLYIPIAMIVAGLALHLVRILHFSQYDADGLVDVLPVFGVYVAANLVMSFVAMILVVKIFELSIGAPGPAVLKLIAIVLVPSALADAIGFLVGSDSFFVAMMVSSILYFPLCFACFWFLFDFDAGEALWAETALWLVNQWILPFALSIFTSSSFE